MSDICLQSPRALSYSKSMKEDIKGGRCGGEICLKGFGKGGVVLKSKYMHEICKKSSLKYIFKIL